MPEPQGRSTQRKGDRATSQALASFTALGWDVSVPFTESAAYDLIVDDGFGLHRVQCKYTSGREVNLRRVHSNSQGYVVKKSAADAYDWLYVLRSDGTEFLFKRCFGGRNSVTPKPEHALGAVAESGRLQLP